MAPRAALKEGLNTVVTLRTLPLILSATILLVSLAVYRSSNGSFFTQQAPPEMPCPYANLEIPKTATPEYAFCAASMMSLINSKPGNVWPPPCPPPDHMREAFEGPDGMQPITKDYCLASAGEGTVKHWDVPVIEQMRDALVAGRHRGSYTRSEVAQIQRLLEENNAAIKGKVGLVIGSEIPWVEALLLNAGASTVWTFEYATIHSTHPQVKAKTCKTVACEWLADEFPPVDFVISFSSIEHSGLGRYGDGLNPDGDKEAFAQAWCLLKPDGLAFIGFPMTCTDKGRTEFNAHRVYGLHRLDYVSTNFEFVGFDTGVCRAWEAPKNTQSIAIFKKPGNGKLTAKSRLDAMRKVASSQEE